MSTRLCLSHLFLTSFALLTSGHASGEAIEQKIIFPVTTTTTTVIPRLDQRGSTACTLAAPHIVCVLSEPAGIHGRTLKNTEENPSTYNDIKASPVNAAITGFILILALVLVHEHLVVNVLHVRSHAKHVLYLLEKIKKDNAVAVKLNLKLQERKFSQENGTVKRWNVNNGSVRSTKNGSRFAAAAGHWNYYFIGFLLLATPHFANASFTPADKTALKTAVDACLSETGDGSCPIFAASNDNTGNPYGIIGTWDVSSVTDMTQST